MKRIKKITKKLMTTLLVVFISINTFGAIVGDYDGSAFTTKEAFEQLKSDFQGQIDKYNSSIDNKIDGKIASYIAGITMGAQPTLLLSNCRAAIGSNPFFRNSVLGQGSSTWTTALNVTKQKGYTARYILGKKLNSYNMALQFNGGGWRSFYLFEDETTTKGDNVTAGNYFSGNWSNNWCGVVNVKTYDNPFVFRQKHVSNYGSYVYNDYDITWELPSKTYMNWSNEANGNFSLGFKKEKVVSVEFTGIGWTGSEPENSLTGTQTRPQTTYTVHNVSKVDSASRTGSGDCWQYRETPWGTRVLERYYQYWFPVQTLTLDYKTYRNFTTVYTEGAVTANAFLDNQTCTYTPSLTAAYGTQTVGTKYSTPTTNNLVGYCQQNIVLNKSTTDINQYETCQWGRLPVTTIYCSVSEPTLSKSSTNLATSYTNLAAGSVNVAGVDHTVTGVTNNVYEITGTPENLALDSFEVNPYTGIAGETVYIGGGIPFAYTQTANPETTFTIEFATLAWGGGLRPSTPLKWMLSTKQFTDGDYANASDKLAEGTVTTDSSGGCTVTTTINDLPANQLIWLNAYSTENMATVMWTDCSVTVN